MIRAEDVDGREWIIPLAWTSLRPRAAPLTHNGVPVRLAPDAVLALAAWVAARLPVDRQQLPDLARDSAAAQGDGHGVSEGRSAERCGRARADRVVGGAHPPRDAGRGADPTRRSR
jgi:hypothetical protein